MRLEFLLQFIVPLTFLAIWALTSLLNRDAQPLPPRPGAGRGPGMGPGRAMGGGGFAPPQRGELSRPGAPARPVPAGERGAPARWTPPSQSGRPGPAAPRGGDDGIVILDESPRSGQGSTYSPPASASGRTSRGTTPSARRAGSRARPAPAPPAKPAEPERRRSSLEGLTTESLSTSRSKPLQLTPLSTPMAPMSSLPLSVSSLAVPIAAVPSEAPTLTANQIQDMLASPKRLREVALLGELLQPPLSRRGPRQPR